jgi:hypothetical protein
MMNPEKQNQNTENVKDSERREALLKVGKFAAYAAPFTLLALTNKADAASGGSSGGRHPIHPA